MSEIPRYTKMSSGTVIVRNQDQVGNKIIDFLDFFRNRSYSRVLVAAGVGGVLFTAWYIYTALNDASESESEHSVSVSVTPSQVSIRPAVKQRSNLRLKEVKVAEHPRPASIEVPAQSDVSIDLDVDDYVRTTSIPKLPEDKVIIHTQPRAFYTPSIATAPLQLETFMRVAKIPYEVQFSIDVRGKDAPFMTYGNKVANNFRECIRILEDKFDVDLEKEVTPSRRTASHLVEISLENQFSWAILIWRWIHDEGKSIKEIQPMNSAGESLVGEVAQKVKEATRYHLIGQLDKGRFIKTINQGLHDISAALGKHKYFQGPTPGIVDCQAFAVLVQIMWNMPGSPFEYQLRKYSNLKDFIIRMKNKYWPDWNEIIERPREYQLKNADLLQRMTTVPSNNGNSGITAS